ncbi:MAG: hypothetical protein Q7R77_02585 [Candidatus Daviesbacteria bacterium]|nr:hypothetical protein [Candidatus Daviesbacteria bacterium]
MEKAILKTLIYADIFDYPLKINEIHKWLIAKKATLRQIEKVLKGYKKYYFLPKRGNLVLQRLRKEKQSVVYFRKAKILSQILKLIPWIKLVGISGGLAINNAGKSDDIDLFIITRKDRLWLCRLLCLGLLSLTGQRRKVTDTGRKIAGKLCLNILLEEDKLEQKYKDIFVAHEVLQMKVLWQRNGIYSKYLADNNWAFKFLPNWMGAQVQSSSPKANHPLDEKFKIIDFFENLAKKFQLKIMQTPMGLERIEDGALYFHPDDIREEILKKYNQSLTSSASF